MSRARTALEQIAEKIVDAKVRYRPSDLTIHVGDAAAMSICCQTLDKQLPHMIGGVVVKRTGEFRGWEVFHNGQALE